jgi:hypothetical protein
MIGYLLILRDFWVFLLFPARTLWRPRVRMKRSRHGFSSLAGPSQPLTGSVQRKGRDEFTWWL